MASQVLLASPQVPTKYASGDHHNRGSAAYAPCIWGELFLSYGSTEAAKTKADSRNELKEEVRRMLLAPVKKLSEKLDLIDDIQRLGVFYHFEKEVDEILQKVQRNAYLCDDSENGKDDLYTVALRFQLLRQQGYNDSCDKFNKFKDGDGKFKASLINDVRGLLSLYEATHLAVRGEDILDEALTFTTTHLKHYSAAPHPPSQLSKQITHALYQPLWKGIPRLEARHYLSIYEARDSKYNTLLTFAKMDFNLVQQVHQKELSEVTRWWKDCDFVNKLPFARHRVVESYLCALAYYSEPEYYLGRRIICKCAAMTTVIDDFYDVHGTPEEVEVFTQAVERWDISAIDTLPEYIKVCYQALLDVYSEFEEALAKEGNLYAIHYARESIKVIIRGYLQEAKWYHQKYIPTMDEHMRVSLSTSLFFLNLNSIAALGNTVTKESFEWLYSDPKIVHACSIIGRLKNDLVSFQYDEKRGDVASSVECYIKHYGVTAEEAITELNKQVNNAWKDLNEGWLTNPTNLPPSALLRLINGARFIEIVYKHGDGFTDNASLVKDHIAALFVEPVPI